jgi:hypothetical protein
VERVLSVYRWQENGYVLALRAGAGDIVRAEPFEAVEIDVGDIFGVGEAWGSGGPRGLPQR